MDRGSGTLGAARLSGQQDSRGSKSTGSIVFVLALGAASILTCSRTGDERQAASRQDALNPDLVGLGEPFDRGSGRNYLNPCFNFDASVTQPLRKIEAEGFTFSSLAEVDSKVSVTVGGGYVAADGGDSVVLTTKVKDQFKSGNESVVFGAVATYTSHEDRAGPIVGPASRCTYLSTGSPTGLGDFIDLCGTDFLRAKRYGGRIMVSYTRGFTSTTASNEIEAALNAKVERVKFDLAVNLSNIASTATGNEVLNVVSDGMPFPPYPDTRDGGSAFTVWSIARYLRDVVDSGLPGAKTVELTWEPYHTSDMRRCLDAGTGAVMTVSQPSWECMHQALSRISDSRDRIWSAAGVESAQAYAVMKSEADSYLDAGRLIFYAIDQTRCNGILPDGGSINEDGNPAIEFGSLCGGYLMRSALAYYENCRIGYTDAGYTCRELVRTQPVCQPGAPPFFPTCSYPPGCSDEEVTGRLASVPRRELRSSSSGGLTAIKLSEFDVDTPVTGTALGGTANDLCAITGVSGYIHWGILTLSKASPTANWQLFRRGANSSNDHRLRLAVTCTALNNFRHFNLGNTVDVGNFVNWLPFGTPETLTYPSLWPGTGRPYLRGIPWGLEGTGFEAHVAARLVFGDHAAYAADDYPFDNIDIDLGEINVVGVVRPDGGAPIAGTPTLTDTGFGSFAASTGTKDARTPDEEGRDLNAKRSEAFCFLTRVGGRFWNRNDSIAIDYSSDNLVLRATTPRSRDRNPFANAQCIRYDSF